MPFDELIGVNSAWALHLQFAIQSILQKYLGNNPKSSILSL
ncbi:hypothetical protein [Nostoc sp.]